MYYFEIGISLQIHNFQMKNTIEMFSIDTARKKSYFSWNINFLSGLSPN